MHNIKDHKTGRMFDPWQHMGAKRRKHMEESWAGVFRKHALPNLPVGIFMKHYCWDDGRPGKELYASLGLLVLQQMHDTTDAETVENFLFSEQWHYALDITDEGDESKYISLKTLWTLRNNYVRDGLSETTFKTVSEALGKAYCVNTGKQRLDSKLIESNMRNLGRLGVLSQTTRGFLMELKRAAPNKYAAVSDRISKRYAGSDDEWSCFSMVKPSESAKKLGEVCVEMRELIEQFRGDAEVSGFESYALMLRVFDEQCEVKPDGGGGNEGAGKVVVSPKAPKNVPSSSVQNPSDPDAGYDTHKGQGYKMQVMETYCSDADKKATELNLIAHVAVSAANEHDVYALAPAVESAAENGMKPETILADSHYGSGENIEWAAGHGVEVISPVMGGSHKELDLDDFKIDEAGNVTECPAGHSPTTAKRGEKKFKAAFDCAKCGACEKRNGCPAKSGKKFFYVKYDEKMLKTARRRMMEKTEAFKSAYRMRAGVESTMSQLDRRTGVGRLRVRGLRKVEYCAKLKALGVNIFRAAAVSAARAKKWGKKAFNIGENALDAARTSMMSLLIHTYSTTFYMSRKILAAT